MNEWPSWSRQSRKVKRYHSMANAKHSGTTGREEMLAKYAEKSFGRDSDNRLSMRPPDASSLSMTDYRMRNDTTYVYMKSSGLNTLASFAFFWFPAVQKS